MNIAGIKQGVTRALARGVAITKYYAPEILTGTGIVGGIVATVLVARATLKLEERIDEGEDRINYVKAEVEAGNATQRDLWLAYVRSGTEVAKLYVGPVTLYAASTVCILAGHGIMRRRVTTAVAAFGVLEQAFEQYRERVREEIGEEKEKDLYMGVQTIQVKEGGKTVTKKVIDPDGISIYARIFNRTNSTQWDQDFDYNVVFLKAQERFANQKLHADGFLVLNDLYDALGFKKSSEGALVGWIDGEGDVGADGHTIVSFDMDNMENIRRGAYLDGDEGAFFLDFNVQGPIYHRIGKIPSLKGLKRR